MKIEQAIRLTKPDIDLTDLRHELLSRDEAQCLALRVPGLLYAGRAVEAIRFGEELLSSLDHQATDTLEYHEIRVNVEFNVSQRLELEGRYADAARLVRQAKGECLEEQLHSYLPQLLYSEARMDLREGRAEESQRKLSVVIPYLDLIGDAVGAAVMRGWAARELGVSL
ncbi:hypothetical protein [Olsenella sp. Marseille-P4559]|uniref:hypothetical protein n=1 Tax=Olsenella sp. Marseille-P4559 TaxID=2364795 RepID=UPI001030989A|nr:hypothetical protein [Olsenella sp. Marseille-P4559]